MSDKQVKKVAIVGAGMMGADIGLEFARFGYEVSMQSRREESLQKAMSEVREQLDLLAEQDFITAAVAKTALDHIRTTTSTEDCVSGADHVIEAVPEVLTLKQEMFQKLDEICPPEVTIVSNASGLRVDDMVAKVTGHPERTMVTHYWQPAHLIPLVEVICGTKTSPAIAEQVATLLRGLRKKVVIQPKELATSPAGWGNAMQWALNDAAKKMVEAGCDPVTVDNLIRFGFGRRLTYTANFYRVDILGLEMAYNLAKTRGNKLWTPYQKMAEEGHFGMSSGQGFYDWSGNKAKEFLKDFNIQLLGLLKRDMEKGEI